MLYIYGGMLLIDSSSRKHEKERDYISPYSSTQYSIMTQAIYLSLNIFENETTLNLSSKPNPPTEFNMFIPPLSISHTHKKKFFEFAFNAKKASQE